jgi:hypothetical protein
MGGGEGEGGAPLSDRSCVGKAALSARRPGDRPRNLSPAVKTRGVTSRRSERLTSSTLKLAYGVIGETCARRRQYNDPRLLLDTYCAAAGGSGLYSIVRRHRHSIGSMAQADAQSSTPQTR